MRLMTASIIVPMCFAFIKKEQRRELFPSSRKQCIGKCQFNVIYGNLLASIADQWAPCTRRLNVSLCTLLIVSSSMNFVFRLFCVLSITKECLLILKWVMNARGWRSSRKLLIRSDRAPHIRASPSTHLNINNVSLCFISLWKNNKSERRTKTQTFIKSIKREPRTKRRRGRESRRMNLKMEFNWTANCVKMKN